MLLCLNRKQVTGHQFFGLMSFLCLVILTVVNNNHAGAQQMIPLKLQALQTVEQEIDTTRANASPRSAMMRSIVFPGWGQWYNRRKIKSIVIFSGEIGLATGVIVQHVRFRDSTVLAERAFFLDDRNKLMWWLGGFIAYSALDAFVDSYLHNFDVDMGVSKQLHSKDMGVQLNFKMPLSIR